MTIQSVDKMWSRTSTDISTPDGRSIEVRFSEGWQVLHDVGDSEIDISLASGLPQLGDRYPGTQYVYCVRQNPVKVSPIFTLVAIEYSGKVGPGGPSTSPTAQEPVIEWSDVESTEAIDQDVYGNPIVTANGEPIDGATMQLADQVLLVERPFLVFNPYLTSLYRHSVSSDFFMGYPPGCARLTKFRAKRRIGPSASFAYWDVSAEVTFRRGIRTTDAHAWHTRIRHEGYYVRTGAIVTFSGGGGSGAIGSVVLSQRTRGSVIGVHLSSGGVGYTSTPTVTISGGGGTGAAATAIVTNERVSSVTVTTGGRDYKSEIKQAKIGGEPVVRPLLLKADGQQEYNPDQAVWVDIPTYLPLPYQALGLV